MNHLLAQKIVEECIQKGIEEFCIAAGSRNAPLIYALCHSKQVKIYQWSEERSAAFFAIGRIKATGKPAAIVTTSGTAAAEVLPAAMSAHYLGLPLLILTADRPRRFRKTGAPQTAEQIALFGCYAHFELDLALDDNFSLDEWSYQGPAHVNICFEEPCEADCQKITIKENILPFTKPKNFEYNSTKLDPFLNFIENSTNPLVVLGSLPLECKEDAVDFLLKLKAPIYAEGTSYLREDNRLKHLLIKSIDKIWQRSAQCNYSIDGLLRLGEIPTGRLWRDLEEQSGKIDVCSISELPFSGLSWSGIIQIPMIEFFKHASKYSYQKKYFFQNWKLSDEFCYKNLLNLFDEEPQAEASLFHTLSCSLPDSCNIYLGNSLPIREWDLAACYDDKNHRIYASRGVNGIDGQISTFLGICQNDRENWGIIGDLTALYDMAGPWILPQLSPSLIINLVIINNGGGQIFSRMYSREEFINAHKLQFKHLAAFWNMEYEYWTNIPEKILKAEKPRLIEIVPDNKATNRFWKKLATFS